MVCDGAGRVAPVLQGDGITARKELGNMQEVLSTLMLVCAAFGSLAFGVLVAYGMARVAFAVFRIHSRSVAQEAARKASLLHT
jgi:hypothetical protein